MSLETNPLQFPDSEQYNKYPKQNGKDSILLSIFTVFSGVIAYLILWIVMPREPMRFLGKDVKR